MHFHLALPAALVCAALAGCGLSEPPRIFAFDYVVVPVDSALRNQIASGATRIDDILGASPCAFILDSKNGPTPRLTENGTRGTPGYNVTVFGATLVNASARNPESCAVDPVADVAVTLGGPGEALDVGDTTMQGEFRITVGSTAFTTNLGPSYLEGKLTGPTANGNPDFVSADFEGVARSEAPAQQMLIFKGSYLLD